ncbi:MAG TPA: HD domain-containing phosphohydrolase [Longimicrobiales bacterium]
MRDSDGLAKRSPSLTDLIESGRTAERVGALGEALEHYNAAFLRLSAEGDARTAAELLRWIGHVHRQRGDLEIAEEVYGASLAVAEQAELPEHVAAALNSLAVVEQTRGRLEAARRLYLRSRSIAETVGDERLAAMIDQNLGAIENIRGNVAAALDRYRTALTRLRRLGDDLAAAWVLTNMGITHVDEGDWDSAESCFDQAFEVADRLRDTATLGSIEINRAELYLKRGAYGRARECCDRAFEIFGRLDSSSGLAEAYKFYGILYRETEKPHLAELHLKLAIELAEESEDRLLHAESERELALVHRAEGRNQEALASLNRAHRLFTELEARRDILDLNRHLDRLEDAYLRVVEAWGESIESKDRYTAGHCQRVADYTCRLAAALGFTGRDLTWIRMGAFLHDVGKTMVPAELLNKPGKLTPEEWEVMRRHTVEGDRIVAELDFPWDIRPIVRSHHERWDGGGYPDGLAGEAIPLIARILCVADVFDALTTARSYRPALTREEALRIMERDAGRLLDPQLFETFRAIVGAPAPAAVDVGVAAE